MEFIYLDVLRTMTIMLNACDITSDGHFMFVFGIIPDPGTTVTPDPSTTPESAVCPVVNEVERINCIPDQPPTKV